MRVRTCTAAGRTAAAAAPTGAMTAAVGPAAMRPGADLGHLREGEEHHGENRWRADRDAGGRVERDANPARYPGRERRQDALTHPWSLGTITH